MKLYYFDIYGRAEGIRMLLTHAKAEWEDVRINGEKLGELKASGNLEFGQVPALEHDGKWLAQSWSILRYLGKVYGYYPSDAEAAWKVDSTLDAVEDYLTTFFRYNFEQDEEKKKVAKENWLKFVPGWLTVIEKRVANNESQHHIVGSTWTIADFALVALFTGIL